MSLDCTGVKPVNAPPAKRSANRPSSRIDPFLVAPSEPTADCLRCRLASFPLDQKLVGQTPVTIILPGGKEQMMMMPGMKSSLEIEYVVRKDGSTEQVRVKHAPNKQIETAVTESVQGWIVVPNRLNGSPIEEKRRGKINVSCQAFPSNDEAHTSSNLSKGDEISPPLHLQRRCTEKKLSRAHGHAGAQRAAPLPGIRRTAG